jgi:hypothetical protein
VRVRLRIIGEAIFFKRAIMHKKEKKKEKKRDLTFANCKNKKLPQLNGGCAMR